MRFPATIGVANIIGAPTNIEVPTNTRTNIGVRNNIGAPVFNCVRYINDDPGNMDAAAIREKIPALTCPAQDEDNVDEDSLCVKNRRYKFGTMFILSD